MDEVKKWLCNQFPLHLLKVRCRGCFEHSHKKWKDSLEGSLDRLLFAAELEFPTILVPRLPQHTSDVKVECAGKSVCSRQLYYLYVASF